MEPFLRPELIVSLSTLPVPNISGARTGQPRFGISKESNSKPSPFPKRDDIYPSWGRGPSSCPSSIEGSVSRWRPGKIALRSFSYDLGFGMRCCFHTLSSGSKPISFHLVSNITTPWLPLGLKPIRYSVRHSLQLSAVSTTGTLGSEIPKVSAPFLILRCRQIAFDAGFFWKLVKVVGEDFCEA